MFLGLIRKIILPKSSNRDKARKEFILNILLLGSLLITFFALIVASFARYEHNSVQGGLAPLVLILILLLQLLLLYLSKSGKERIAALFLISFFYLSGTYTIDRWGAEVAQAWLIYALLIIMAGVLIGARFAFFLTLVVAATGLWFGFSQSSGSFHPDLSWKVEPYSFGDAVLLTITLSVIAVIVWLYTREIEISLKRARISEAELKRERDLLEIKVEERTKDLKQAQLEKMTQLYRFAEIGRLSSGLFHDLATPLSLISLHLDRLKYKQEEGSIENVQAQLKKAVKATKYLETFVKTVRKQLQNQGSDKVFSLNREIKMVMRMLNHKATSQKVKIVFNASNEIKMYGDQIKFNQLMINLILNAIDAYEMVKNGLRKHEIIIDLTQKNDSVSLSVKDHGIGIIKENLSKIFQPFFSTKAVGKGTGIGLSISQEIVEKNFGGKIDVQSSKNTGTVFTILFPFIGNVKPKQQNESIAFLTSDK